MNLQKQCVLNSTGLQIYPSCSILRRAVPTADSGTYVVAPTRYQGLLVSVFCDMTSNNGVGVTEIGHDSESKTLVDGYEDRGSYRRKIKYDISMQQIVAIMNQSKNCEQFIKYECYHSKLNVPFQIRVRNFTISFMIHVGWWVSREGSLMNYWGGAAVDSNKCACGMTNSCAGGKKCNCDKDDKTWREDSGYLTDKNTLPVTELRFGDTGHDSSDNADERGYHTLGKLRCWG